MLYSAFIPIIVKYVVGIEVASFPKHSYKTKDALNTSGLKINLIYNDGSIKEISSGFTTLPENGNIIGETTEIKITYGDMVTYYKINIDNVSSAISKSGLVSNYLATFKNATDVQIEELLNFHYAGDIDIADYWKVGDTRQIVASLTYDYTYPIKIVDFNKTINNKNYAIVLLIGRFNIPYNHTVANESGIVFGNGRATSFNINKEYTASIGAVATENTDYGGNSEGQIYNYIKHTKIFKPAPYAITNKIKFIIESIPDAENNYKCVMRNSETIYSETTTKTIPLIKKYIDGGDESFKYFKIASNRKEISGQMLTDYHFKQEDLNYISFNKVSGFGIDSYYSVNNFNVKLYKYNIDSDGNLTENIVDRSNFLNIFSTQMHRTSLYYIMNSYDSRTHKYKSFCFL